LKSRIIYRALSIVDASGSDPGALEAAALFAHVNDSIRQLASHSQVNEVWEFLCECPDLTCHMLVTLTLAEFDARRAADPPVPVCANHGAAFTVEHTTGRKVSSPLVDGIEAIDGG
jgi:hypothetical protein